MEEDTAHNDQAIVGCGSEATNFSGEDGPNKDDSSPCELSEHSPDTSREDESAQDAQDRGADAEPSLERRILVHEPPVVQVQKLGHEEAKGGCVDVSEAPESKKIASPASFFLPSQAFSPLPGLAPDPAPQPEPSPAPSLCLPGMPSTGASSTAELAAAAPEAASVRAGEEPADDLLTKVLDGIASATQARPDPDLPTSLLAVPSPAIPSHPVSLPPKPPTSMTITFPPAAHRLPSLPVYIPSTTNGQLNAPTRETRASAGPPGTSSDAYTPSLPPPPPPPMFEDAWRAFLADEKRHTSGTKKENWPDGSRIFIGNLSIEKVSKREVFNVFHKFGRLAQISLKKAYGFAQYHTADEGLAAIAGARGIELGGRVIKLEVSKPTTVERKTRERSPIQPYPDAQHSQRRNSSDRPQSHGHSRRQHNRSRSRSPRRFDQSAGRSNGNGYLDSRQDIHHGSAPESDQSRNWRRSSAEHDGGRCYDAPQRYSHEAPQRYGNQSPLRDGHDSSQRYGYGIPQRYEAVGAPPRYESSEVPEVQIILLQQVPPAFVEWVDQAFRRLGLRTNVTQLNPEFSRNDFMERQIVAGVLAMVDLDWASENGRAITVQIFRRSGSKIDFLIYPGIHPDIAAQLVFCQKQEAFGQQQPTPQTGANYNYHDARDYTPALVLGHPYQSQHHAGRPLAAVPQHVPPLPPHQPPPLHQERELAAALPLNFAEIVGKLDNAALQAVLASLQQTPTPPASSAATLSTTSSAAPPHVSATPLYRPPQQPQQQPQQPQQPQQADVVALLNSLGPRFDGGPAVAAPVPQPSYGAVASAQAGPPNYSAAPAAPPVAMAMPSAEATLQVQSIIEQLKRVPQSN